MVCAGTPLAVRDASSDIPQAGCRSMSTPRILPKLFTRPPILEHGLAPLLYIIIFDHINQYSLLFCNESYFW